MSRRSNKRLRPKDWALTLLTASLLAAGAWWATSAQQGEYTPARVDSPTHDRIVAAAKALRRDAADRRDGVYVAPDAAALISKDEVRQIRSTMERSPVPIMFAAWRPGGESGLYLRGHDELAAAVGKPAFYVIWEGPGRFYAEPFGTLPGYALSLDSKGSPVARMEDLVTQLAEDGEKPGTADDLNDALIPLEDNTDWGGWGFALAAGIMMGALAGLVGAGLIATGIAWWTTSRNGRLGETRER